MAYSFEDFCNDCRDTLKADSSPERCEKVRLQLERLLANEKFVE